jgi:hypothetical protein
LDVIPRRKRSAGPEVLPQENSLVPLGLIGAIQLGETSALVRGTVNGAVLLALDGGYDDSSPNWYIPFTSNATSSSAQVTIPIGADSTTTKLGSAIAYSGQSDMDAAATYGLQNR